MKKRFFLLVLYSIYFILNSFCFAQNKIIDSLLIIIKRDKPDTSIVNNLTRLSREYISIGSYDSALHRANDAVLFAKSIESLTEQTTVKQSLQKATAASLCNIGLVHWRQSEYSLAIDYYLKALKIYEGLGIKSKIAGVQGNIAGIYLSEGNATKALD